MHIAWKAKLFRDYGKDSLSPRSFSLSNTLPISLVNSQRFNSSYLPKLAPKKGNRKQPVIRRKIRNHLNPETETDLDSNSKKDDDAFSDSSSSSSLKVKETSKHVETFDDLEEEHTVRFFAKLKSLQMNLCGVSWGTNSGFILSLAHTNIFIHINHFLSLALIF